MKEMNLVHVEAERNTKNAVVNVSKNKHRQGIYRNRGHFELSKILTIACIIYKFHIVTKS